MSILAKTFSLILLISTMTSCYRMPENDEFSMVPSTNNPNYTREKANQNPGVGY
ncbi:MAG TPA: hypothetical protein VGP47_08345 [Parachlamydiaceae bacterium]|nr:hypothetical protein [Parachlamydiaceae bacterium]